MAAPSLTPAAAAFGRLRDVIEFGRSAEHPGFADVVDRAGYAVADLRDRLVPLIRDAAREIARGEARRHAPTPLTTEEH